MAFKIVLSAGHGRYTAGKRCMKKLDPDETREWILNSRIAEKIENLLAEYTGWELLRVDDRTGKKDITLRARSDAADAWGGDVYIALHHNAGINGGSGGGIVSYAYTKPSDESIRWRDELYSALIEETGLKGNRASPLAMANFHEVREPDMPAVLLELGFMDSKTDVPIILSETHADKCARAIVRVLARKGSLQKGNPQEPVPPESIPNPVPTEHTPTIEPARSKDEARAGKYLVSSSDGFLNLRSGPDADKQLIEVMPNGTKVTCYGFHTDSWLLVISGNGNKGFCHSAYLKPM